jgi:hypothetical protein
VGEQRDCTCATGGPGWETCYDVSPAIWGACVCNAAPVADGGGDRDVSYNTTVRLDGTHSSDPEGGDLQFHWTLDSKPSGSVATLEEATTPTPAFLADVIGDYGFTLTVDDTIVSSEPVHITISARNDAPAVVTAIAPNAFTGEPMTLDGSATTDANADPLAFAWTVAAPPGSTAVPADPAAATTTFVPDVDGAYEFSLAVDDGRATTTLVTPVHSYHRLTDLPVEPARVEYDRPLDLLLFTSHDASAFYIYDPSTDAFTSVPLIAPAGPFSISPDGTRAVVADNTGITSIDLQTKTAISRHAVPYRPYDVVDGGDGWAYVFPAQASPRYEIRGVRLSDGAVTVGAEAFLNDMSARWMPGTSTIYATDQSFTQVFAFANGATTLTNTAQGIGTAIWTADDGMRVFSFGPSVYAADMTEVGQLRESSRSVTTASTTGTLLAIPASANADTDEVLDVYSYPGLVYDHSVTLPAYLGGGNPVPVHGRHVFMHADGVHYSIVVQVEPLSVTPGHWAVTNF